MCTIAQSSRFFFILDIAAALRVGAAGRLVLCSGKWSCRIVFRSNLQTLIRPLYLTDPRFRKRFMEDRHAKFLEAAALHQGMYPIGAALPTPRTLASILPRPRGSVFDGGRDLLRQERDW